MNFPEDKTPAEQIESTFKFLTRDFGYQLISKEARADFKAKNFLVYRNTDAQLQVEICGDSGWFHCELRRLVDGVPAKYGDSHNCVGFESLAILESNPHYDHMHYFAGGRTGLSGVLQNTASLFQRQRAFFTTPIWIDVPKLQQLRDEEFYRKFKSKIDRSKPDFLESLKIRVMPLLTSAGYGLLTDSAELPPFHIDSNSDHLIFKNEKQEIIIRQGDWRDDYYTYNILMDGLQIAAVHIRTFEVDAAVEKLISALKHKLEQ